jgi:hypothetical protein
MTSQKHNANPAQDAQAANVLADKPEAVESIEPGKFETLKRAFETAYPTGEYTSELQALSTAIAYSVLRKCLDPQRKTAPTLDRPEGIASNNGVNPVMLALYRSLGKDVRLLENTLTAASDAVEGRYNEEGDYVQETGDVNAKDALNIIMGDTLSDAYELVNVAVIALLEQCNQADTTAPNWLDKPYNVQRIKRRVRINPADAPKLETVETTPIQEAYRAVRRAILASRAVQTDPRNGYIYIEDITADGLDTLYVRAGRAADISGKMADKGITSADLTDTLIPPDITTRLDFDGLLDRLDLTPRQNAIMELRMRGYGHKAIATYLGVRAENVKLQIKRIRAKAEKLGIVPFSTID